MRRFFSHSHVPVDTLNATFLILPEKILPTLSKNLDQKPKILKGKYWTSFKIKKKQASQFFSGQENSNFDFLLINCGHNSHLSALKNPRTTEMKLFFFQDKPFAGEMFRWKQKRIFGNAPEKSLAGFWKKNRIKHRKGWKKKNELLSKFKKNTSHFYSGKYQSRFDNLLKKVGQKSVLSSLKKSKNTQITTKLSWRRAFYWRKVHVIELNATLLTLPER